jgi:hypothetical protein
VDEQRRVIWNPFRISPQGLITHSRTQHFIFPNKISNIQDDREQFTYLLAVSYSGNITFTKWITVNNELERIWNKTVVTKFKAITLHLPETKKNHETPVRIAAGPAEDRTGHLPNANQKRCWLCQLDHSSEQVGLLGKVRNVGFEVLRAMIMKRSIFWDITPCSHFKVDRRSGGIWLQAMLAVCFMPVSRFAYSSTLMVEETCFAGRSVEFQRITQRYIPKTKLFQVRNAP